MISNLKYFGFILILLTLFSCKTKEHLVGYENINDSLNLSGSQDMMMEFTQGKSFNHPTMVIWMEDMAGNYMKTLYITKAYASGIFGHKMVGDTIWLPVEGISIQPAALPYWTHRKGLINQSTLVPNPENPFVDAYTGATPQSSFTYKTKTNNVKQFRVLVEFNQTWDWNNHWSNDKFPDNNAYKHSAQPSLIYSVEVNNKDSIFYLNPIGHGSPTGEDGKLYTNLETLSTALDIFSEIRITIKK